jgi:hypothetical protein
MRLASMVVALLALAPGAAHAGKLGALKPKGKPLRLLAGRLSMKMPPGSRLEARQASIMAAPEASQDESRIVLDAGPERLVVMVNEVYALAGAGFEAAIRKEAASSKGEVAFKVEALKTGSPKLKAWALVPSKLAGGEASLVLASYLAAPDGTVQLVRFYVNPAGAKDARGCATLARAAHATLLPGARKLGRKGGVRALGGHAKLEVTTPRGYVATLQPGPDFEVHHLRKLAPFGTPAPSLGIYVGGHPSFQHKQRGGVAAKQVVQRSGKLLGAKATWYAWPVSVKPARTMLEAMAPVGRMKLHVFASGANAAEIAELLKIAESIKVKRAP